MIIQYIIGALLIVTGIYFLYSVYITAIKLYKVDSLAEKFIGDAFMLFCFLLSIAAYSIKVIVLTVFKRIRRRYV